MDRYKKISIVAAGIILALSVTVTASPLAVDTPLYTVRMEQMSHKMHFLPTAVNGFDYIVEGAYNVNCDVVAYCAESLGDCTRHETTCLVTCPDSCQGTCGTCQGVVTCDDTSCQPTCPAYTCLDTCWETCDVWCTVGGITCKPTCDLTCDTCPWTC